jgi:hypothetical protein
VLIGFIIIIISVAIVLIVTLKKSDNNSNDDGRNILRENDIDKKLLILADKYKASNGDPFAIKIQKFTYLER